MSTMVGGIEVRGQAVKAYEIAKKSDEQSQNESGMLSSILYARKEGRYGNLLSIETEMPVTQEMFMAAIMKLAELPWVKAVEPVLEQRYFETPEGKEGIYAVTGHYRFENAQ